MSSPSIMVFAPCFGETTGSRDFVFNDAFRICVLHPVDAMDKLMEFLAPP